MNKLKLDKINKSTIKAAKENLVFYRKLSRKKIFKNSESVKLTVLVLSQFLNNIGESVWKT